MTECGAGSVTLDTIIAKALRSVIYGQAVTLDSGYGAPAIPHDSEFVPQLPVEAGARAVTDALLAEGQIVRHTDWGNQILLVLPLPARPATPQDG